MSEVKQMVEQGKVWIDEISTYIRESSKGFTVDTKSDAKDLVTEVDREVERLFVEKIKGAYPDHFVIGEEGFGDKVSDTNGIIWIIDPIDGTMNFVHQQRNFAISIGVYRDGKPLFAFIYDVAGDDLFHAIAGEGAYLNGEQLKPLKAKNIEESIIATNATWLLPNDYIQHEPMQQLVADVRGMRSLASASLEMAYVAASWTEGYISIRLAPWDFAAGYIIGQEVGAITTDMFGENLNILEKGSVIIAPPGVHEVLIQKYVKKK